MTDFATEGLNYDGMSPDVLACYITNAEVQARCAQASLARITKSLTAMRKAQRRQATLAKGGKLPQHTRLTPA